MNNQFLRDRIIKLPSRHNSEIGIDKLLFSWNGLHTQKSERTWRSFSNRQDDYSTTICIAELTEGQVAPYKKTWSTKDLEPEYQAILREQKRSTKDRVQAQVDSDDAFELLRLALDYGGKVNKP